MSQMFLASNNEKKREELVAILPTEGIEIVTPASLPDHEEPEETGETFSENARIKALYYAKLSGKLTLADDSGLVVDALEGAPGVRSARYSGEPRDDKRNLNLLLENLQEVADKDRTARFVCAVALARGEEIIAEAIGSVEGSITLEPEGYGGFGYDPIFFYPPGRTTFASLSSDLKNRISHRARALAAIAPKIRAALP